MFLFVFIFNVIYIVIECEGVAHDLPPYFPRCHIDDPQLNECILKAANSLKPMVIKGIKEISLPSFEPLVIPRLSLSQHTEMAKFNNTVTNFTVHGMDSYDIKEMKYDTKTHVMRGRVEFGQIGFSSIYDGEGRVFIFDLKGKGKFEGVLGPVNGTFEVRGDIVKRKGVEHYRPTAAKVQMVIDDLSINYGGLFDANEELARLTNELINQNGKAFVDALTPGLESVADTILMRFMKTLTRSIPYYKLFPKSSP